MTESATLPARSELARALARRRRPRRRPAARSSSRASAAASASTSRACCTASAASSASTGAPSSTSRRTSSTPRSTSAARSCKDVFRAGDIEAVVHLGVMHDPRASAGRAPLVERGRLHQAARVRRAVPDAQARRPLQRQRLRPAAEQPAVPRRGGAAARRRRTSATSATSSRSTCSRRASSGSCPRPRRSSSGPCTSSARVHNAPSNFLRLNPILTRHGLRPDGAGHPPGRRRARHRARAPARASAASSTSPAPSRCRSRASSKILGRQRVSVPYSLARVVLRRLWSLRLTTFPAPELDHIRYVCMVDDRRARQVLGFAPQRDARGDRPVRGRRPLVAAPRVSSNSARRRQRARASFTIMGDALTFTSLRSSL